MKVFDFLKDYIVGLSEQDRGDPYLGYMLHSGKSEAEIHKLELEKELWLPNELREFYKFSYGALLGEYKILTISEIASLLSEMHHTYEEDWIDSILPFAYVRGIGDVVAFNLEDQDKDGFLSVLDGFHELPPDQWKSVCYGLRTWLIKMVDNRFSPFWMG